MKLYYIRCLFSFFLLINAQIVFSQHDECGTARNIILRNSQTLCDTIGNFGATASSLSIPNCFNTNGRDIWLSFRAIATDVRITISNASGATNISPQAVLYYTANCQNFEQMVCRSGNSGSVELYRGGLTPGETYFLRLQSSSNANTIFRYCIINYNPPSEPTSDCPTSTVLCDKSPFAIQSVTGAGTNSQEAQDASCFFTDGITTFQNNTVETNSTWFKWTCAQSGSLTFTITPLVITDDIDFIIYELPNSSLYGFR
jgi:hypothetical protein